MYETWEDIKRKYPRMWVVMVDAKFRDHYHVHLLGGEVFCTASNQEEMYSKIPDDGRHYVCEHTSEGVGENGLLKSRI